MNLKTFDSFRPRPHCLLHRAVRQTIFALAAFAIILSVLTVSFGAYATDPATINSDNCCIVPVLESDSNQEDILLNSRGNSNDSDEPASESFAGVRIIKNEIKNEIKDAIKESGKNSNSGSVLVSGAKKSPESGHDESLLPESDSDNAGNAGHCINPEIRGCGSEIYSQDKIIVRFDIDNMADAEFESIGNNVEFFDDLVPGLAVIHLSGSQSVEDALDYYSKLPYVLYAEPDYILSHSFGPEYDEPDQIRIVSGKSRDAEEYVCRSIDSEQEYDEFIDGEFTGDEFTKDGLIGSDCESLSAASVSQRIKEFFYFLQWSFKNTGLPVKTDWRATKEYIPPGFYDKDITYGKTGCDISIEKAWAVTHDSSDVIVAVMDSGILYTHPDLFPNIYVNENEIPHNGIDDDCNGYIDDVCGWDFVDNDNMPLDPVGHGTHCAGTIAAAKNNYGTIGMADNVILLPIRFADENGRADSYSDEFRAIRYAKDMGAKIISCSWSGPNYYEPEQDVIKNSDMLFVVSAGNDGMDINRYPAAYDCSNIVSVVSTGPNDELSWYSNYGPAYDLAAPGEYIFQTAVVNVTKHRDFSSETFYYIENDTLLEDNICWGHTSGGIAINGAGWGFMYSDEPIIFNGRKRCDEIYFNSNLNFSDEVYIVFSEIPFACYESTPNMIGSEHSNVEKIVDFTFNKYDYMYYYIDAGYFEKLWNTDTVYVGYLYISNSDGAYFCMKNGFSESAHAGWEVMSGTSMAVPHVTGTAALMLSVNPDLKANEIAEILRLSTDKKSNLKNACISGGRLNASAAVLESLCYPVEFDDDDKDSIQRLICNLLNGKDSPASYDLNKDGVIDGRDLILLQDHFQLIGNSQNLQSTGSEN